MILDVVMVFFFVGYCVDLVVCKKGNDFVIEVDLVIEW